MRKLPKKNFNKMPYSIVGGHIYEYYIHDNAYMILL